MTETEKQHLRGNRAALEAALRHAGSKSIHGNTAKCPWHDDRNPSGSIHQRPSGAWAFRCHTCNINEDVIGIRKRIGDPVKLRRDRDEEPGLAKSKRVYATLEDIERSLGFIGAPDGTYEYTHPDTGVVEMVVMRLCDSEGRKRFLQASPGEGGFLLKAPSKPWPIYNRTRVRAADQVIVVEGEKCVHALTDVGLVATTSPGGAGKASFADWSPLAGKRVYLWPDADPVDPKTGKQTGIDHMRQVAAMLDRLEPAPEVLWVDPEVMSLPEKGDVVDFLELCGEGTAADRRRAVECVLSIAQPVQHGGDLDKLIEDTIAGRRKAISWPFPMLGKATQALLPGTVTCLCGDPGSTKSLLVLEAATYWHQSGEKIALYELEDDRAFHMNRILAQLDHNSSLCDAEWVERNPDAARAALRRHARIVTEIERRMDVAPDEQVTLEQLATWVEHRCREGARILVIDPITLAAGSDKPWIDDLKFLVAAKATVRRYGASLILVTHPRKGSTRNGGLGDLAGGAAYPRFAHTVLWIEPHAKRIDVRVANSHGDFHTKINRVIHVRKARNGRGGGWSFAFDFVGTSLRSAEQGVVLADNEDRREIFDTPHPAEDPFDSPGA